MHETCLEYLARRLSEGWKYIEYDYPFAVLLSPNGIRRELDLRNDIETLRPNAPGDECYISEQSGCSACPNHYDCVDEETPDEGGTYLKSGAASWERDLYHIQNHEEGSDTINHITVYARSKRDAATTLQASLKIAIKSGATIRESDKITVTQSWANYSKQWATDPNTGSAWIWTAIDALQIGVALRRNDPDWPTCRGQCTQVYVEVDYTSHKEIYVVKKAGVRQDHTSPTPDFEVISTGTRQGL